MFCNEEVAVEEVAVEEVAILVLVDSVLQCNYLREGITQYKSRNPCFSGQCFAILCKQIP